MVRLNVTDLSNNNFDLDLKEDFRLNYSNIEVQDITRRKSPRSQSFALPFSKTNSTFFKYFELNNSATSQNESFSPYLKVPATIYVDGIPLINGFLQLITTDTTKKIYNCVVFDRLSSLANDIKDSTIRELVAGELDHDLTYTNVLNSWSKTLLSGNVIYPFIDWGEGWAFGASGIDDPNNPTLPNQYRPCVQLYWLMNKMFTENGYTWDSAFLESTFFKNIYVTFASFNSVVATPELYSFQSTLSVNQTLTGAFTAIEFDTESYDNGSCFNPVTFAFTAIESGKHELEYLLHLEETGGVAGFQATIRVEVDSGSGFQLANLTQANPNIVTTNAVGASQSIYQSNTVNLTLKQNDIVRITALVQGGGTVRVNNVVSKLRLNSSPKTIIGASVDLADNIDDKLKQLDFLRAILERFNLVVTSNKNVEGEMIIEPYDDFYALGTSLDWTSKLVNSESVVIEPMSKFRSQTINFSDLESEGYLQQITQTAGFVFGSTTFESQDDFATGSSDVFSVFEPIANGKIKGSNVITGTNYQINDNQIQPKKSKPSLIYYDSAISATGANANFAKPFYLFDGTTSQLQNSVPVATSFQIPFTNSDTSLDFNLTAFAYNSVILSKSTTPDIVNKYWRGYLNELYSDDARFLKAEFDLTPSDINNLQTYDLIFVKDSYWKINKISGYNTRTQKATVELIKKLDVNFTNCQVVPDTYNADSTISFVDIETGLPAAARKDCCELVGGIYRLVGETATCYWRNPNTRTSLVGEESVIRNIPIGNNQSSTSSDVLINGSKNDIGGDVQNVLITGNKNTLNFGAKSGIVSGSNHEVSKQVVGFEVYGGTGFIEHSYQSERSALDHANGQYMSQLTDGVSTTTPLIWQDGNDYLLIPDGVYGFEIFINGFNNDSQGAWKWSGAMSVKAGTHALIGTPAEEWEYRKTTQLDVVSVDVSTGLRVNVKATTTNGTFTATLKYTKL